MKENPPAGGRDERGCCERGPGAAARAVCRLELWAGGVSES